MVSTPHMARVEAARREEASNTGCREDTHAEDEGVEEDKQNEEERDDKETPPTLLDAKQPARRRKEEAKIGRRPQLDESEAGEVETDTGWPTDPFERN